MSDWSPRPHDETVEPLFGGLAKERSKQPPLVRDRPVAMWLLIASCAAAIAVRAWTL